MKVIKVKNYDEMSSVASDILSRIIVKNPQAVLGLATGSTPVGIYKNLVERYRAGELDFSKIKTVNLDEYKGLSKDNDQSYYHFMHENLFNHVNLGENSTFIPNGSNMDEMAECRGYEEKIASLGYADVQLLGIGRNGHIGFNEPSEYFPVETHCVDLTQSTIEANRRFFDSIEDVPRQAYTMGIGTIMKSDSILIVASGEDKAWAVKHAFYGPVTPKIPASILQFHKDVTLVADEAALTLVD